MMSIRPIRRAAALASLAAAAASTARAQRADTTDSSARIARIAPVVVSVARESFPLERVPASVTVLDGAELRDRGIVRLADALRDVPGLAVVRAGSYGAQTSLFVRGGQSNHTKVLIDGIPYNDPGGSLDLANLTLDDVERIEIVRGPSSVVYGSDAATGLVQIFTKHGAAHRASLDARGGTYGTVDVVAAGAAEPSGVALDASAAHHATRGIYAFNSALRDDGATLGLAGAPWDGARARATARYADVRSEFPTDFTGAPVDPNAYRTERRTLLGGELAQSLGRATATLGVTSNLSDGATIDPPNAPGDVGSETRAHTVRQAVDGRVGALVGGALLATVGGMLERQHLASPNATRRNAAVYGELARDGTGLSATAGARLDHSATYGDFGTFRVAASRAIVGGWRLRAGAGTAFREPSFAETYATSFSIENLSLRPERVASWEVGSELRASDGRASAGATWFDQRLTDLVDYHYDPAGSRFENVARARARGVEMEGRVEPTRTLSVDAGYTFLDTRVLAPGFDPTPQATIRAGGPLLRRPRHGASLGAALALGSVHLDARAAYVGRREDRLFHGAPDFTTDVVMLAPYTTLDVGALLTMRGRSALTLRLENAFDARYQSVAGYATPGRVVLAGVRLE